MAKAQVKFLKDHTHTIPATDLVTTVNGVETSRIPVPEKVFTYTKDQILTFRSKKDAKSFVQAHGADVCVVL